jgi:ribosome-binding factor A
MSRGSLLETRPLSNKEHSLGSHKDRQVCRQVFEALSLALADVDDPLIDDLALLAVDPAPDAKRVLVTLGSARTDVDLDAALARLGELSPELRTEVAAEVHRKQVPELLFRVVLVDAGGAAPGGPAQRSDGQ